MTKYANHMALFFVRVAFCMCFSICLAEDRGAVADVKRIHAETAGKLSNRLVGMDAPEGMRTYAKHYVHWQEQRDRALAKAVQQQFTHTMLQKLIDRELTPGHTMLAFRKEVMKRRSKGTPLFEFRPSRGYVQREEGNRQWGELSGYVTIDGNPANVTVVAFNEQGFFVNEGYSAVTTGGYYIITVPQGRYYVMTFSNGHIDEMYDDVPALFGSLENWRQAALVEVRDGETTENINFDLQAGATITGTVYETDGTTPLDVEMGFLFRVYWADRFEDVVLLPQYFPLDIGQYALTLPMTGDVKIFVEALGYRGEWYQNRGTWQDADPIQLTALGDTVRGIDFSLEAISSGGGGSIAGAITTGDGSATIDYALVVAFDIEDTTLAGFALTTNGFYTISGLPDGKYILYGDDIPLTIFGQEDRIGEYYQDAPTPTQATPVTISGQAQIEGIDFTLDVGGAIKGGVSGPGGEPLDSILVLALHADVLIEDPFLSNIQFGLAMTDGDGDYSIDGLPSGEYILRTLTPFEMYYDFEFGEINIPGDHYGRVVDEYYDGVQNILEFDRANRVAVTAPDATTGIDFTLEAAGAISGSVRAADDSTYVPSGFLFALDS